MERLTFDGNFCDIAQCRELPCPHGGSCTQRKVWEKLKAYEDLGFEPEEVNDAIVGAKLMAKSKLVSAFGVSAERLRELAEADKAERVVVLPCKVGDTLWIVDSVRGVYSAKVRTFFCGHSSAVRGMDGDGNIQMIRTTECDIPIRDFGKIAFLTREKAEKALEEGRDE